MIITMISHPGGKISPAEVDRVARMLIVVHSLALVSIAVVFLGAWGMTRRLDGEDRLAWAGIVVFAVASIAVMNAAVFDGLLAPKLMRQIVSATPETRDVWRTLMNFNFQMNQAFARVYAVASSLAVVLWSVAILRNRTLGRGAGIYGCVLGVATVAGIFDTGSAWIWVVDFWAGDLVFDCCGGIVAFPCECVCRAGHKSRADPFIGVTNPEVG
jgi:hypothetical protein